MNDISIKIVEVQMEKLRLMIENYNDIKVGDIIEGFIMEEVK